MDGRWAPICSLLWDGEGDGDGDGGRGCVVVCIRSVEVIVGGGRPLSLVWVWVCRCRAGARLATTMYIMCSYRLYNVRHHVTVHVELLTSRHPGDHFLLGPVRIRADDTRHARFHRSARSAGHSSSCFVLRQLRQLRHEFNRQAHRPHMHDAHGSLDSYVCDKVRKSIHS